MGWPDSYPRLALAVDGDGRAWLRGHLHLVVDAAKAVAHVPIVGGVRGVGGVSRSVDRARNLEAGRDYAAQMLQKEGRMQTASNGVKGLNLVDLLGLRYFATGGPVVYPSIEQIERTETGWSITLKNLRDEVATVELTRAFELAQPAPPRP